LPDSSQTDSLSESYFRSSFNQLAVRVDRMMMWLLGAEWLGLMAAAAIVSPRVWNGEHSSVHPHLLAAIFAGPAFILPVIGIALLYPARALTRHAIAVSQILVSGLLIDCTGGRIETHFHIFGSLAFLAFYRDWRVLVTASMVTATDHFVRGIWWPQSIYGVLTASPWRWVEHGGWVAFEDFFLLISMRTSIRESRLIARNSARLYEGASYDVLTGAANRRLLDEKFEECIGGAGAAVKSRGARSAVLFIDLDQFKRANDNLGHAVGDKLLVLLVGRWEEIVRPVGTLARFGGDEFIVLCNSVSGPEDAISLGNRLLEAAANPFHVDGHHVMLSASIGISLFPDHGTTSALLRECADRAMHVARLQGRNQCVAFSPEVAHREEIARKIAFDLPAALSRDEFLLHYQPVVERRGNPTGFEALLRWRHPRYGLVAPCDFIPLAEQSGVIVALGVWVLREACRTCATWQRTGQPGVGVAVNVSAIQFEDVNYPDSVFEVLAETGLDPALLTLELTESVLVTHQERAREHMKQLRRIGIRIALDDFGTGYSSLSYLADLPADQIKLDRSFLNREPLASDAVIESIVTLAHHLGLQVVAEGVETRAQSDALIRLKCDRFQGFYFSRPIAAQSVPELLDRRVAPQPEPAELQAVS
jgi:diguanylate cyclase (GGDEF)-like protein